MQGRLTTKPVEEVISAIQALDLESVKKRVMDPELGEGWSREYADSIEVAYKNYLTMLIKYQDDAQDIMLSKDVDEFWHTHILQTMKYADDCQKVFGTFLHHNPYLGERTPEFLEKRASLAEKTRRLYQLEFGNAQSAEAAWAGSVDAAYCDVAKPRDGAYCDATAKQSAYCDAAKQTAYCDVAKQAAYCDIAKQAAYCDVAKQAAYCDAPMRAGAYCDASITEKSAAYCDVAARDDKPAYCDATAKTQRTATNDAAYCDATVDRKAAAYCDVAVRADKAAYCDAARPRDNAAYCDAAVTVQQV